jgi:hypothetical protein
MIRSNTSSYFFYLKSAESKRNHAFLDLFNDVLQRSWRYDLEMHNLHALSRCLYTMHVGMLKWGCHCPYKGCAAFTKFDTFVNRRGLKRN